jgi:hypothetical protein
MGYRFLDLGEVILPDCYPTMGQDLWRILNARSDRLRDGPPAVRISPLLGAEGVAIWYAFPTMQRLHSTYLLANSIKVLNEEHIALMMGQRTRK